jgi:signal transduction histidine kinase
MKRAVNRLWTNVDFGRGDSARRPQKGEVSMNWSNAAPAGPSVGASSEAESSRPALDQLLGAGRRGEFLAMILHELQNPIGGILAGVAYVRDAGGAPPRSEWLWAGLENATRQVQGLLADLLELCQAAHPTFQLRRRPMDLAAEARAIAERRRTAVERAGLRLALPFGDEPVWVNADPERLELVLGNLLDNAAKYTEPGGRVAVSVEAAGAEAVLRVRDTGVGIAPEALPFVFDPFVREQLPGARRRRGSGVGLLLVRTLVELHGGRAEAYSAGRGRGSEFVVRLPAPDIN